MRDGNRDTALFAALDANSLSVAKYLVSEGADVFARDRDGCKQSSIVEVFFSPIS